MRRYLVLLVVFPLLHAAAPAQHRKSFAISGGGGGYGLRWEQQRTGAMQLPEMDVTAGYYLTPRWALGGRLAGCGATNADVSDVYLSLATQYDATPRRF